MGLPDATGNVQAIQGSPPGTFNFLPNVFGGSGTDTQNSAQSLLSVLQQAGIPLQEFFPANAGGTGAYGNSIAQQTLGIVEGNGNGGGVPGDLQTIINQLASQTGANNGIATGGANDQQTGLALTNMLLQVANTSTQDQNAFAQALVAALTQSALNPGQFQFIPTAPAQAPSNPNPSSAGNPGQQQQQTGGAAAPPGDLSVSDQNPPSDSLNTATFDPNSNPFSGTGIAGSGTDALLNSFGALGTGTGGFDFNALLNGGASPSTGNILNVDGSSGLPSNNTSTNFNLLGGSSDSSDGGGDYG